MPDAITTLTQDHQKVDTLFNTFGSGAAGGDRQGTVEEIVRALSVHAAIEEQVLYPTVVEDVPGGQGLVDESLQEHQLVKETLTMIERLGPDSPELDELMNSLIQHVRHHVQKKRGSCSHSSGRRWALRSSRRWARRWRSARALAPTHPHPNAPDTPPGTWSGAPPPA